VFRLCINTPLNPIKATSKVGQKGTPKCKPLYWLNFWIKDNASKRILFAHSEKDLTWAKKFRIFTSRTVTISRCCWCFGTVEASVSNPWSERGAAYVPRRVYVSSPSRHKRLRRERRSRCLGGGKALLNPFHFSLSSYAREARISVS